VPSRRLRRRAIRGTFDAEMSRSDPRTLAEDRVGQTLNGKWHLDSLLDMGGMAAVYVATHRNGKRVAIKMLQAQFAAHESIRDRFLREGYAANRVNHRGAVSVLDDDVAGDGAVYLVMELLEGESLEQALHRAGGKLPISDVLAVADQVLGVLDAAHKAGIVHRDIKPGNVFVTREGEIKVLDFGLARMRDAAIGGIPTASGIVLGTPSYLPPEQAQGRPHLVNERSDLFAVGALMFRLLSGRVIHEAKSSAEKLVMAMKNHAPPVRTVAPNVPACVADVIDKALMFDSDKRWPDAAAMRTAAREAFAQYRAGADESRPTEPEQHDAFPLTKRSNSDAPTSLAIDISFGDGEKLLTDSTIDANDFSDISVVMDPDDAADLPKK
jgi:serine/threonine protein kinase